MTTKNAPVSSPKVRVFDLKRVFDVVAALFGLVFLSPLFLVIGLLVFISDGTPIFFRQARPGKGGKLFGIVKFRTMKNIEGRQDASDGARLTRLGRFLRSTSLDEIPELFNVLRGDMSLVGPRPLLEQYLPRYSEQQKRRHEVRPGITGLAQVHGRNRQTWNQRLEDDIKYVENQNFILDLKIIFLTLFQVALRRGISAEGSATMPEFLPEKLTPSQPQIEMSSADIDESDVEAVTKVLRSGRLALGPCVQDFEQKMATYIGVKHAIAVSSGTAALHLIIKSLGIGPGDEVLVPSFTFAASVNAILYEGATPVFVDISVDTYNLDPADLYRKKTPRTKAIMVVDVFGHPADWREINAFAEKFGLAVIDDCCEALGAEYDGKKIGSFGRAAAFAFYPNKQMTTGEGGMIVTDDDEIARLCRSYRNQGRDEMGHWLEHVRIGYNYRLDEMSGALGASQLSRLDLFLQKRANVAEYYNQKLRDVRGVRIPIVRSGSKMSWFVYVIKLQDGLKASEIIPALQKRGVPSRAYFSAIHEQVYVSKSKSPFNRLPVTDMMKDRTLALPFHNNMSHEQVEFVVKALDEIIKEKLSRGPVEMIH